MHLMEAIPVLVPRVLTPAMADRAMLVAPLAQAAIDAVLVTVDLSARANHCLDQRFDGLLLDVDQHPDHHLSATLDHPQDRRLLLRQGPAPAGALQSPSSPSAAFFETASGRPL